MNILITNLTFHGNSGTELYVKELAIRLKEKGHHVQVYALIIGALSKDLAEKNILVSSRLKNFEQPDIIHAHHNLTTAKASLYFTGTPVIYFIHDRTSSFDHPFYHPNILKYCAVDHNCKERYLINNFSENDIEVIYNWVNTDRFKLRSVIKSFPKKALAFSNYVTKENIFPEIQQACLSLGIELDLVGIKNGNPVSSPESILKNYDLVFGKAKAGIESMATGAALIVCDFRGLGEMVRMKNVEYFRTYNFGMKLMNRKINSSLLIDEIQKYDPKEIRLVSEFIISNCGIENVISKLENLYQEVVADFANGKKGVKKYRFFNHLYIHLISIKTVLYIELRKYKFLFKVMRSLYKAL